jgi:two-component system response regulator HydG
MTKPPAQDSILVVDDAPDTLEVLRRNFSSAGFLVFTASDADEAIRVLESAHIDLVVTDFKMPKVNGLDLTRHVRENHRDTEVLMITGYPSLEGAVKAIKTGADDYLAKPFTDEELFDAVNRVLKKLKDRRRYRKEHAEGPIAMAGLIGLSPAMKEVFTVIQKAAATTATVLITGESGTGKEVAARAIHYNSDRASSPFVAVNCSAIPENLQESELFGYVRGAFTGADQSRAGFFHAADGGTIFLDEVSETCLSMQAKLLRVIQEREIYMLGSSRPVHVDVRILASTNKDLSDAVRKGTFREDLFYRLNVVSLDLPPLRERREDIGVLVDHFLSKYSEELKQPPRRFSDRALSALQNYEWPGNVRELENLVHRLLIIVDGDVIDVPDLPVCMRFSLARESGLDRSLAEVEAEHILRVVNSLRGNKTRAAEILGIDRKTLREKLKKLGPSSGG